MGTIRSKAAKNEERPRYAPEGMVAFASIKAFFVAYKGRIAL
jgi:hypothetical protein